MTINQRNVLEGILNKRAIFFDFDGVIKDSVEIKGDAFKSLFFPYGRRLAEKIYSHHKKNGGVSRYEKIPLYLEWAGMEPTKERVKKFEEKFSGLVVTQVVKSNWVPGVVDFISKRKEVQRLFVVTATPQLEMEGILNKLSLVSYFDEVIGSPLRKHDAVDYLLHKYSLDNDGVVLIGDSITDYEAAKSNNISFVLRKSAQAKGVLLSDQVPYIDDFIDLCNISGI